MTHGSGTKKGFQFQDRSDKSDIQCSEAFCAQDGTLLCGDSYAFGKCASSSIFHGVFGVEGTVSTVIDFVSAVDDKSHKEMFQSLKQLDDGNISPDRDTIRFNPPIINKVAKCDNGKSKRSALGYTGSQKRLANTEKVHCGIRGIKYDMMGHGLVNCGDRGLRVDMGKGVVNCGDRGLRVDTGKGVVDIQGRGAFVSYGKGTRINRWGIEVLVKNGSSIKLYQSKKHGNQSLEEAMSEIPVDGIKTLSSLARLFTGIIESESHKKFLICGGTRPKNYYNKTDSCWVKSMGHGTLFT